MKLFLPSGPEVQKLFLRDEVVGSGFFIRMSGNIPDIELRFYLLQDTLNNGGQSYYVFTLIPDLMSIVANLFDVEHEWRFEHKNLIGDPDGYAETEIYCDDVLLKREKINFSGTGSAHKAIGFNQGTGPDSIYSLRLGNIGTKVSYFIMNEKPLTLTPPPPPPSLFDVDFIANGQILEGSGLAESTVTTDSQNYLFNAEGQFETTAEYLYVHMLPTNWSALIPAIQSSSQVKLNITLPDGPDSVKFRLKHNGSNSGFYIQIFGDSTSPSLWYLARLQKGVNGNGTGAPYFFFVDLDDSLLSLVPDLYDKEHEWRFEHKLLYDDPDGYVEAEVYCDDVLIHTEKFNYANTGAEQRLIGFNQDTSGPFSLWLGDIGTKLTSISIDEKPV
jgi:hypothetical protein